MDGLKLFAFTCGTFQSPRSFFGVEEQDIIRSPVPAYLIAHPKGLALFDTGLNLRYRHEADDRLGPTDIGFDIDESAEIAARLRAIDIDPGDIKWIINSHFHADHCGGNGSIPNATLIVQDRERAAARNATDPRLYDPRDYDLGHPVLVIDGEHDLHGDGSVVIFPTFGHTPGHQSVRVALASGDVVLTADCCYLKYNLDALVLPAFTADRALGMDTLRNLRRLRDGGARIFYGHDRDFWATVPQSTPIG